MADPTIRIKRSAVPGKIPNTTNLQPGELAVNTYDGKVYIEQDQGGVGVGTTVIVINPWSVGLGTTSYNTYFNSGNVGIKTSNPLFAADVEGDVRVRSSNKMRFGGTSASTNFYIQYNSSANSLDFVAG